MSDSAMGRLFQRLQMLVGRGRLTIVNDSGAIQSAQIKLGSEETRDEMPRLAEFGFTSNPPAGSDTVAIFISGDRSTGVIIATGHQASRLKGLQPGETAVHDDQGQKIYISRTGIVIDGAGLPMTIRDVGTLTIDADVVVNGQITATGNVTAGEGGADQVTLQTHKHPTAGNGPPSAPTPGT